MYHNKQQHTTHPLDTGIIRTRTQSNILNVLHTR